MRKLRLPGNITRTLRIFSAHPSPSLGLRGRRGAAGGRRSAPARRRSTAGRTGALRQRRPGTPGSRHQLKAVKVIGSGRGAWHRSTRAHKGGFLKSSRSSNSWTPGRRLSPEGLLPRIRPRGRGFPRRRLEAGRGRRRPGENPRPGPRPSNPPRASKRRSAPGWRAAISRASTAPVSRWARPPRPPPPVKSGAPRPLTRSPPKPAARRACPLPLLATSENARARPRRGRSWLHSPGLGGNRAAEYLVDPSAAGEPGGGAEWVGVEREKRGQVAGLSYQGHQSRARVPSYGQVSRSALAGPTSSWETREGEQSMWKGSPPGKVDAPGHGSAQL